jgi:hypothetical protein
MYLLVPTLQRGNEDLLAQRGASAKLWVQRWSLGTSNKFGTLVVTMGLKLKELSSFPILPDT